MSSTKRLSDLLSDKYTALLRETTPAISTFPLENVVDKAISDSVSENVVDSSKNMTDSIKEDADAAAAVFSELVLSSNTYPTKEFLTYQHGFTPKDFEKLNQLKYDMSTAEGSIYERINLPTEDGKHLYYYNRNSLEKSTLMFQLYIDKKPYFQNPNFIENMIYQLLLSEIKCNTELDGRYPIKRKLDAIINDGKITNPGEQYVQNTYLCYKYIINSPINEENLFELYNILTTGLTRREIHKYRHGDIIISGNLGTSIGKGVAPSNIEYFIKRLFAFIDYSLKGTDVAQSFLATHIIHYYFLYVSPYFDHNATIARLLSTWFLLKCRNLPYNPLFLNEALNHDAQGGKYMKAFEDSLSGGNDLTYFVDYLSGIIFKYFTVYMNLSEISDISMSKGFDLSKGEDAAIKVILTMPFLHEGYFDWRKFKDYEQNNLTKQYYNRLLNGLEEKDILESITKNSKLYRLKTDNFHLLLLH